MKLINKIIALFIVAQITTPTFGNSHQRCVGRGQDQNLGNQSCGVCQNNTYTWWYGRCVDGGATTCSERSGRLSKITVVYSCAGPSGTWGMIGCHSIVAGCSAVSLGVIAACCASPPWAQCVACIAGVALLDTACACAASACYCNCQKVSEQFEYNGRGC